MNKSSSNLLIKKKEEFSMGKKLKLGVHGKLLQIFYLFHKNLKRFFRKRVTMFL